MVAEVGSRLAWKLPPLGRTCKICGMFVGGMVMCAFNWSAGWWQIRYVDDWLGRPRWGAPDIHRRAWEMLDVYFPKPAAPDVARPSDRGTAVSRDEAASHRSVISRARSVAAPPRRLAADVCRIHARSPNPWTPVTDVWLVLRRIDCPPRLDLVRRCVSNGPEEPFILIATGWCASP